MKYIFKIENIGIKEKLLVSLKIAIKNENVIKHIISHKRKSVLCLVFLESKALLFKSNKETTGETTSYSYSNIESMWKMNASNTKCDFFINFKNNNLVSFSSTNTADADQMIIFFNQKKNVTQPKELTPKNSFKPKIEKMKILTQDEKKKLRENKNIEKRQEVLSIRNVFNPLQKNIANSFLPKKRNIESSNPQQTSNKIVNQNSVLIANDKINSITTFSSSYISDLFSKRNILLPDGTITLFEKLQNKLDSIELSIINPEIKSNISNAIQLGSEVSEMKKKIISFESNKYDDKILDTKVFVKREIDNFSNEFNYKLSDIANTLKSLNSKEKSSSSVKDIKVNFNNEVDKIKKQASDDRKFLERTSALQKELKEEFTDAKKNILANKEEIYITQKAWVKMKQKIDDFNFNNHSKEKKSSNFGGNQMDEFKSEIKKLVSNKLNFNDSFKNTVFDSKNKILAIDKNGNGAYFNIQNFKDDIVNIIKQNEVSIYSTVEQKMGEVQKISDKFLDTTSEKFESIKKWYEEIKSTKIKPENYKRDEFNRVELNVVDGKTKKIPKEKIFKFKSISYNFNEERRHGIRPGMKWSINDNNGRKGVNSLYVSENNNYLVINNYDGIIFRNIKYYFNIPSEFIETQTLNCQFQAIKYGIDMNIDKIFNFNITEDFFTYFVNDGSGELIDDSNPKSSMYDLKWLIFFRD